MTAKKVAKILGGAPERTIECSGAQFSVNLGVYVSYLFIYLFVTPARITVLKKLNEIGFML